MKFPFIVIVCVFPFFSGAQSWERITLNFSYNSGWGERNTNLERSYSVIGGLGVGYHLYLGEKILVNPSLRYNWNTLNGVETNGLDFSFETFLAIQPRFNFNLFFDLGFYNDLNDNPNALIIATGIGITPWAKYGNNDDESWKGSNLLIKIGPALILQESTYIGFKMSWINCLGNTIPRKQT